MHTDQKFMLPVFKAIFFRLASTYLLHLFPGESYFKTQTNRRSEGVQHLEAFLNCWSICSFS